MTYFDAPYRPADLTLNSDAINSSLVHFWALTDGSGTSAKDISTTADDLTATGTPTWVSSDIGTGVELVSNTTYLTSSVYGNTYQVNTPITISAWVKFTTSTSDNGLFQYANVHTDGLPLYLLQQNGASLRWYAKGAYSSGMSAAVGEWHHVALTNNGTSIDCYLNGQYENTLSGSSTAGEDANNKFWIGAGYRYNNTNQFQNVRIFNAALTATQVEQLYTRPWTGTNYDTEALWLSPPASPTLSSASQATSIMTSCVGWWPLTEGSGTTATDLVGSNDGTLTSGVGWKETALGTSSEHTHGNDYISTGLDLTGESAVTVSAWVRSDGVAAGIYGKIVCQAHNANFDMHMAVTQAASLNIRINSTTVVANNSDVPPNGTWFHVCAVWQQSSRQEIYVNGKLSASVTADTSVIGSNPHNVFIGGTTARSSRGFDGGIQNVRIWNRALSSDEVSLLYERPWIGAEYNESFYLYPPVPSSLTPLDSSSINTDQELWLPLTDGTGTTAVDISGGGNDGTLDAALTHVNTAKGAAVSFPANGGIDSSATISSQPYSVSLWGYMNSATTYYYQMFIGQTSGSRPTIYINNSSLLKMYGGSNTLSSTTTIGVGEWFHVVGVFDGSSSALYVNGVVEASGAVGPYDLSGGMRIGHWWTGGRDFDGNIQNVRVWSRALSASEVADIYYSPWLGSAYTGTSSDPATNRFFSPAAFARLG